jgi:hypothetical protein
VERLSTVAHDVPTGLLDIANVQADRILEALRRIAASGRLITIEDIGMLLHRNETFCNATDYAHLGNIEALGGFGFLAG